MSRSTQPAFLALCTLLAYYTVYRWLPLGRWNWQFHWPVSNDQFFPDIVICLLLAFFAIAFLRTLRASMIFAVFLLSVWVALHLFDWWVPYARDSAANYARYSFYAPHTQILPVIGHHYPPDAGHAVLDFILFPTWLLAALATLRTKKLPNA